MISSQTDQRTIPSTHGALFAAALVLAFASLMPNHADAEPPQAKLPVPDELAQKEVLALIRELYKDDYKDKAALSRKLIQKADESRDNPTGRFVLLWEAQYVAADGLQVDLAFAAIETMAGEYDVSSLKMK